MCPVDHWERDGGWLRDKGTSIGELKLQRASTDTDPTSVPNTIQSQAAMLLLGAQLP